MSFLYVVKRTNPKRSESVQYLSKKGRWIPTGKPDPINDVVAVMESEEEAKKIRKGTMVEDGDTIVVDSVKRSVSEAYKCPSLHYERMVRSAKRLGWEIGELKTDVSPEGVSQFTGVFIPSYRFYQTVFTHPKGKVLLFRHNPDGISGVYSIDGESIPQTDHNRSPVTGEIFAALQGVTS